VGAPTSLRNLISLAALPPVHDREGFGIEKRTKAFAIMEKRP
jgi:hypothetical protein